MKKSIAKRHSAHQTQWAAQFAVASELCKRGYEVALTSGNHPQIDLMVVSPKERHSFFVDVKGLYRPNYWLLKKKPKRAGLFYVFVYVPVGEANSFFILTQKQVNRQIRKSKSGRGLKQKFVENFSDRWDALPD